MAKTNAQRQADYRAKRKLNYADDSTNSMTYDDLMAAKVRLDVVITKEAKAALDRLACAKEQPLNSTIIELILNADKQYTKSLQGNKEALNDYHMKPLRGNDKPD